MGWKKSLALTAVVGVLLTLGLAATAAEETAVEETAVEGAAHGEVVIEGRGWLHAKGVGEATLSMGGVVGLRIDGDVKIEDHAGDMRVWIDGVTTTASDADIELEGFRGTVRVRGTHFTLKAEGAMELVARGHGIAKLEGRGYFETRRSGPHPW